MAIFALAAVGCLGTYFTQTSLFDAGSAFDLPEEALDSNAYTFTLWDGNDFWTSTKICGEPLSFGTWKLFNKDPPELSSVGDCNAAWLRALQALATIVLVAAGLRVFLVVAPKNFPRAFHVGCALDFLMMAASLSVICVYVTKVDPTRLSPSYCEEWLKISPNDITLECGEYTGFGFYCQVAVAVLSLASLIAEVAGRRLETQNEGAPRYTRGSVTDLRSDSGESFFTVLRLNQTLRFFEFAFLLIGVFGPFMIISLDTGTVENGTEIKTTIQQTLFDEYFCKNNLWWGRFGTVMAMYETFGDCSSTDLHVVIALAIAALALSGMSLVGLKNARFFPRLFLLGVALEVLTLILVSSGVGYFVLRMYPGRESLDPSYCDLWLGEYPPESGGSCRISYGYSFVSLCVSLGVCAVNILVEVVATDDTEAGVRASVKCMREGHGESGKEVEMGGGSARGRG